ncbi:MAG: TonB family protein [Campylobacterota bacterium]|nr:TonB family protein [Campylobacterota bacterium]
MIDWSSQSKRDLLAWFLTFLIYLPFLLWWNMNHATLFSTISQTCSTELTLDLEEFQKESEVIEEPSVVENEQAMETEPEKVEVPVEPEEESVVEEAVVEEPIIEESAIEKIVEEEVIPEPPVIPETVEVLSEKTKPVIKKQKVKKKPVAKVKKKQRKPAASRSHGRGSAGKSRFLATLKSRINARKVYPRIAQKRGMQGKVRVHFTVTATGGVSNIMVKGPRIFANSAKAAVRKAFPMPTQGVSLPMKVALTLNYRLKN